MSTPDSDLKQAVAADVGMGCLGCMAFISTLLRPVFFLFELPFRVRHALRKRAYRTGYTIEQPPFPPLVWTEYDWWEGEIELTGWTDFRLPDTQCHKPDRKYTLTVLPAGQTVSTAGPSTAQGVAIAHLASDSATIADVVCQAVMSYYNSAYEADQGFFEDLRPITSHGEIKGLLSLSSVYVHHHCRDGAALIGLGFGCAWDEEHGLGVLLHRSTVVEIGQSDISFSEPQGDQQLR